MHLTQLCSLMPCTVRHARTAEKSGPGTQNTEEDVGTRHGYSTYFTFFLALSRLEELYSLLFFSWSLDYSHTGYAEILAHAGKGALSIQNILLYGNESTMWQLLNSAESPKQMLLLIVGKEASAASKSKSNTYLCFYFVCLWLFLFFLPLLVWVERRTFPASADQPVGILVETGNSVDYSLAIRLLSLRWLSLLHHEIAWPSARLESVLCSNPPCSPPPADPPPLRPFSHPCLSFPHPGKKVNLAPLRSARQCSSKTGWLAAQSLLPHFLWPRFYPVFFL